MRSAVVTAERDLYGRLERAARELLGPTATKEEVAALAEKHYADSEPARKRRLTEKERKRCREEHEKRLKEVQEWGLPEP